jgi:hypothetical protein
MITPPFCLVLDTKAFRPQHRLRNLLRQAKSTHKAHTNIFYPGLGRPLANNPMSCFGGLSRVDSVQDDEHSSARRMLSVASTPPRLPSFSRMIFLYIALVILLVVAKFFSSPMAHLDRPNPLRRGGASFYTTRLVRAPPKGVSRLNRSKIRSRREGGWFQWPMDGHGRCADTLDGGVTARAASFTSVCCTCNCLSAP